MAHTTYENCECCGGSSCPCIGSPSNLTLTINSWDNYVFRDNCNASDSNGISVDFPYNNTQAEAWNDINEVAGDYCCLWSAADFIEQTPTSPILLSPLLSTAILDCEWPLDDCQDPVPDVALKTHAIIKLGAGLDGYLRWLVDIFIAVVNDADPPYDCGYVRWQFASDILEVNGDGKIDCSLEYDIAFRWNAGLASYVTTAYPYSIWYMGGLPAVWDIKIN